MREPPPFRISNFRRKGAPFCLALPINRDVFFPLFCIPHLTSLSLMLVLVFHSVFPFNPVLHFYVNISEICILLFAPRIWRVTTDREVQPFREEFDPDGDNLPSWRLRLSNKPFLVTVISSALAPLSFLYRDSPSTRPFPAKVSLCCTSMIDRTNKSVLLYLPHCCPCLSFISLLPCLEDGLRRM